VEERPAVFLDRDGTITVERGHITAPDQLELIEGAGEAIDALRETGFLVVVVSNQSGVARGLMSEDDLDAVHRRLEDLLARRGASLDGAYYCPNYAGGTVERFTRDTSCRKPETGMIDAAVRDLGIDLATSFLVGDQASDIEAANRAGVAAILVRSGKGGFTSERAAELGLEVAHEAPDLAAAARWIVDETARGRGDVS